MKNELPVSSGLEANRTIVRRALILVAMLCLPIVALMLMQAGIILACTTQTMAEGVAPGRIAWRITQMHCRNGQKPFYDVAVGAEDKTLTTALTSRGAPVPLEVVKLAEGVIGVKLDQARPGADDAVVQIRLRASGSPRERIDLQADATQGPAGVARSR